MRSLAVEIAKQGDEKKQQREQCEQKEVRELGGAPKDLIILGSGPDVLPKLLDSSRLNTAR